LWFDGRFRTSLARAGLRTFRDVMATSAGRCLRILPDRENWYLWLGAPHAAPLGMYLKKHHVRTWKTRLRAWLGIGPALSAGRAEAQNIRDLSALGIGVPLLAAHGEELRADGLLESFLLTEELVGYEELGTFVLQRFSRADAERRDPGLDRLIRQVATIARRFHAAGYNHRDFYCCHFLVKEVRPGEFDIRLIDLQRMERRQWFRRRWIVKDLAQLAYSAPDSVLRCREKLLFLRHYLGVGKLRPEHKRLVRAVVFKQRVMERKLGKAGGQPVADSRQTG
jgi:heptose I phosphotransferase